LKVKESKAAKRLFKRVNKMISKMDTIVNKLQDDGSALKAQIEGADVVPEAKQYVP
jgi:LETM1 and EF-hand domain-containing protein 1